MSALSCFVILNCFPFFKITNKEEREKERKEEKKKRKNELVC